MTKGWGVRLIVVMGILFSLAGEGTAQETAAQETKVASNTESPNASRSTAAAAGVIDESLLAGLPMNGRSYIQLTTLQGGVSDSSGGGRQGGGSGGLSVSGGRREWNSFMLDGTDINDTNNQVPTSAAGGQLGSDAVQQVQVFSVNYSAQYGRAAGGITNAITRSGGNQFHGTVFEFLRNSKVDARNFFDTAEKPPFKRNQFGATVTGPIVKEKVFFMVGVEILRNRLSDTSVSFVPDNDVRSGVLALPGKVPIFAVPQVKPYLLLYPSAETPLLDSSNRPTGIAENRTAVAKPSNEVFLTFRVDQRLGDKDAWFGRYTFSDSNRTSDGGSVSFLALTESRQQYLTLTETHFFSPSLVNTVRLGYTRPVSRTHSESTLQIPSDLFFVPGSPQFGVINVPGLTAFGPSASFPSAQVMNSYQAVNDLIYAHGPHAWKFGLQMERFQWNVFDSTDMGAQWSFNNLEGFLRAGPSRDNTLRVALPGSTAERAYRQTLLALYAQDDYKLRSNLTVNLGLRYEFLTMLRDAQGRDTFLKDELRDTKPQVGRLMSRNPALLNLAPRIGLGWSPWGDSRKLVVRVGAGIYYDPIIEYGIDTKRNTIPFFKLAVLPNFAFAGGFPNALNVVAAEGGIVNQVRILEYNNPKTPIVYRYNLSLQREFLAGLTVEANYVGYRGNRLLRNSEVNLFPFPEQQLDGSLFFPPQCDQLPATAAPAEFARCRAYAGPMNPAFSVIEKTNTDAQAFYNSLVISANRRPWKGLSLGGNYTFSKGVDDGSATSRFYVHYPLQRTLNRGLSKWFGRHRVSMNYFYNLPLGGGQRWLNSGGLAQIFGGWRVGGILRMSTGIPTDAFYQVATPGYLFISDRANLEPGRSNNPVQGVSSGCQGIAAGTPLRAPELYFDPCAFSAPAPGTIGNAGRNIIVAPRTVNLDFSLQKDFTIDSQRSLQFRAEFFNFPNHTNFSGAVANIFRGAGTRNPNAGKIRSTDGNARQIQFALRLSF